MTKKETRIYFDNTEMQVEQIRTIRELQQAIQTFQPQAQMEKTVNEFIIVLQALSELTIRMQESQQDTERTLNQLELEYQTKVQSMTKRLEQEAIRYTKPLLELLERAEQIAIRMESAEERINKQLSETQELIKTTDTRHVRKATIASATSGLISALLVIATRYIHL